MNGVTSANLPPIFLAKPSADVVHGRGSVPRKVPPCVRRHTASGRAAPSGYGTASRRSGRRSTGCAPHGRGVCTGPRTAPAPAWWPSTRADLPPVARSGCPAHAAGHVASLRRCLVPRQAAWRL